MTLTNWTAAQLKTREDAVEEELVYGDPSDARRALLEAEFHAIEAEFERRAEARDADPVVRRMRELVAAGAAEDEADALLLIGSEREG